MCSKCKYPECVLEVQKKDLISTCNACGVQRKLDTTHKAGKQLLKDIPTFYANNPEFKGKVRQVDIDDSKGSKKQGAKKKTETEAVEESKVNEERAKKLIAEGGEINALDAIQIEIDSPQIGK